MSQNPTTHDQQHTPSTQTPRVDELPLEDVLVKYGCFEGKLFTGKDKVTYTFIDKQDNLVVILHFDAAKGALFYQGHKVNQPTDDPKLLDYVMALKKIMWNHSKARGFIASLDATLSKFY